MSNQETSKQNLAKEIEKLLREIKEKKVTYKQKLEFAQRSDEELEELYLEN
jgi:L-lactate utilization protein LutC